MAPHAKDRNPNYTVVCISKCPSWCPVYECFTNILKKRYALYEFRNHDKQHSGEVKHMALISLQGIQHMTQYTFWITKYGLKHFRQQSCIQMNYTALRIVTDVIKINRLHTPYLNSQHHTTLVTAWIIVVTGSRIQRQLGHRLSKFVWRNVGSGGKM
jgi:hypothetical protein